MTPEQAAAFVLSQSVCALAIIEGMKAENAHREANGLPIRYGEEAFSAVVDSYGVSHNSVCEIFRSANEYGGR